jgi:poly(hydroxyalkanoate) granule-associated protein
MARTKRNVKMNSLQQLKRAATERFETVRETASARLGEARARTAGAMNHLERAFEKRISQAIHRLGVPSAAEVRTLSREVAQLKASVQKLGRGRARA